MEQGAPSDYHCANPDQGTTFGEGAYAPDEQQRIQELLDTRLGREHLATRAGPGGSKLTYVEGNVAIDLANEVFSFNGWSSQIMSLTQEICEKDSGGQWCVGVSAIMRIATALSGCSQGRRCCDDVECF